MFPPGGWRAARWAGEDVRAKMVDNCLFIRYVRVVRSFFFFFHYYSSFFHRAHNSHGKNASKMHPETPATGAFARSLALYRQHQRRLW